MRAVQNLLIELDRLKSIYRRSYLANGSRNENSAEHSWHLAVALLALKDAMPENLNIDRAIKMALVHDICEIGAGDISVYDPRRADKTAEERVYLIEFAKKHGEFGDEVMALWREYEEQISLESKWVKVVDRLLPFLLNLATEGKTWKEQGICRSQVLAPNAGIAEIAPAIYEWMLGEIESAVASQWLQAA